MKIVRVIYMKYRTKNSSRIADWNYSNIGAKKCKIKTWNVRVIPDNGCFDFAIKKISNASFTTFYMGFLDSIRDMNDKNCTLVHPDDPIIKKGGQRNITIKVLLYKNVAHSAQIKVLFIPLFRNYSWLNSLVWMCGFNR